MREHQCMIPTTNIGISATDVGLAPGRECAACNRTSEHSLISVFSVLSVLSVLSVVNLDFRRREAVAQARTVLSPIVLLMVDAHLETETAVRGA